MNEPQNQDPPGGYRFGPFHIDLEQRLLFRGEAAIPLTPKTFDTLAVLAARPGKIIAKSELLRLVWPDSFVEENNLTQNISALRRALGTEDCIQTIPRRGYRLSVEVETVPVLTAESIRSTAQPNNPMDSLMVLPFVNLTSDHNDEYFSDGLTEELTNALAQVDGLRVVARTTAFQFRGKALDIRSIAQQLNVSAVIEGSVRRQDTKLRVTVQLINASSGYHIWSQTYDRDVGDIFSIQEDISRQVARTIRPHSRAVPPTPASRDLETYNLYLLGRFHRGKPDRASVEKAMAFFQRAIDRDPRFAAAWAGLAECYMKLAQQNSMPPMDAWAAGREAAEKALALDGNLPEAHTTQAIIHLLLDRNWEASEREFRCAIALNGNDAAAHHWFSHYFTAMNQTAASLAESRIALELDPRDIQISAHMIFHYVRARDFSNAIRAGLQTLDLDPHSQLAYLFLSWAYENIGEWDKAVDALQRCNAPHPDAPALLSAMRAEGSRGYWRVNLEFLASRDDPDNYRLAVCHARLGQADRSLAHLALAFQKREPELIYLKCEPAFDWMQKTLGFRALTAALKL
jgi:TolB-like protein/Tfp pilus assembly protein PilF